MARRVVDETRGKEGTDMDEHVIRELTSEVRRGRLSRRRFIQTMVGVGLTAPLADIDTDGSIVPVLAAETPSVTNGGVAPDGTWVQWRLKRGVTWHDGRPFTADDVIFTWQYAAEVATAATSAGSYQGIDRIERIDDYTVKLAFKRPTPYWADAFCSAAGMVLPRHVFESFRGAKSREAPANLKPVGTGPYRYVDFKPGDVLHAEINP